MSSQQSSSIALRFEQLKREGRMALMPFLMAGDPDLSVTAEVCPRQATYATAFATARNRRLNVRFYAEGKDLSLGIRGPLRPLHALLSRYNPQS